MIGERIKQLSEQFGDAFYLLDSKRFEQNFRELKEAFQKYYLNFNIAYSYKTNYTPKLCGLVNSLGGYAEVVSEMELALALKIGAAPEKIIWNGPVKTPAVLETALMSGVNVNLDNSEELACTQKIVHSHPEKKFNIGIRCNFDVGDGVVSRFGFDTSGKDFKSALKFVTETENICFSSLQCHFAKRQLEFWPARVSGMIKLLDSLDILPRRVDLGGALFGKMADSLRSQFAYDIPDYKEYAQIAAKSFAGHFDENGPELLIEPGSALVGDCMKFACTVKSIKSVRGKYIATVLGSQKNISMSGVNPPVEVFSFGKTKHYENLDIVGYTCIEGDVIYRGFTGELAVGDIVLIGNCGSYSLVMKPPFILPDFTVVDISSGDVQIIKRAQTFDDVFSCFTF